MTEITVTQRTIKVKINLTPEQTNDIFASFEDSKIVFKLFTELCCEHTSCSYRTLHKFGYQKAKELCPNFPTAYIQSVAKSACSSVKSFNTNHKKKKWLYKGDKKSISIPLSKLTFSRRGLLSTISTNNKRIRILHDIPEWFVTKYNVSTNDVRAGTISYKNNNFWLCIVYTVPIISNINKKQLIGVDRGLYNLCTLSDGAIISSKKVIAVKRKYQHNRKKLQQKGTRSAKRKLRKLSGREKRFMQDFNHVTTKQLADRPDVSTYVLEDLKGIRKQWKGKKLNSWLSNWSYFQFQSFLEYKCLINGIEVVYVNPRYTSQKCNVCAVVNKSNRVKSKYSCSCGNIDHADLNAAKNIRDNYVLSKRNRLFQDANSSELSSATIPTPCG